MKCRLRKGEGRREGEEWDNYSFNLRSVIIWYGKTIQKKALFLCQFHWVTNISYLLISLICQLLYHVTLTLIHISLSPPPSLTVYPSRPTSRPSSALAVETSLRSRPTTNPSCLTPWKNQPPNKTALLFVGQRVSRCSRPIATRDHRFASPTDEMPSRPRGSTHSVSVLAASHQIWSYRRENSAIMVPSPWETCTLTSRQTSECRSFQQARLVPGRLRLMLHVAPPSTTMKGTAPSNLLWPWEWWGIATDCRGWCTGVAMRTWRVLCQTDSKNSCGCRGLAVGYKKIWKKYRGRVCVWCVEGEGERGGGL